MISAVLVMIAFSSPFTSIAKSAEFFTIGTGGPTGVYFQTGNAICKMLHKSAISAEHGRKKGTAKAYRCTAPSTGGSNYNIGQIKAGEFQFGVAQSDWQYHAVNGSSKWEGKKFGDELKRIGWVGDEKVGAREMHAMFELHIEQGPILEAENKDIGVVTHGQGLRWIECKITGKESHTGSTPMRMRKNAGRGLALVTELVHEIAMKHQPNAVGAIGHIDVYPNSRNIIPGQIVCTVDMRTHLLDILEAMVAEFEEKAPKLCSEIGVDFECSIVGQFNPPAFDEGCVSAVREAAEELGYSHMDIVSGAGHDACWINDLAPTAMIMCPCEDGLSHNEAEEISKEWAQAGTDVLLHAVLNTAIIQ